MPKQEPNYTLAFILRSGKEYVERLPEEAYPDIVSREGLIGVGKKKDQARNLYLIRGGDGLVLAQWREPFQINMSAMNPLRPLSIPTQKAAAPVPDQPKRRRRTRAEMERESSIEKYSEPKNYSIPRVPVNRSCRS